MLTKSRALVIVAAGFAGACATLAGLGDFPNEPDAAVDARGADATVDAQGVEAGGDAHDADTGTDAQGADARGADATVDAQTVDASPTGPWYADAAIVAVSANPSFTIDAYEVTVDRYAAWQITANVVEAGLSTRCAYKLGTGFSPAPGTDLAEPVTRVDWCDAYAFCAAIGRVLCDGMGGATLNPEGLTATNAKWTFACTAGGAQLFPYGTSYVATACNIGLGGTLADAGAFSSCVGAVSGLYDMVGNAWEWIDACDDGGCAFIGGSFVTAADAAVAGCGLASGLVPSFSAADVGFRCCSK